jgi:hypothetical protein
VRRLRIIRIENTAAGLIGVLTIDGIVECFTLQPDPTDIHFSIPSGAYHCIRHHGPKYPDTLEIVVKGHSDLLFHILNLEDESRGCVGLGKMVGEINGKRSILGSGDAFRDFMKKMGGDQEANLFIEDSFG